MPTRLWSKRADNTPPEPKSDAPVTKEIVDALTQRVRDHAQKKPPRTLLGLDARTRGTLVADLAEHFADAVTGDDGAKQAAALGALPSLARPATRLGKIQAKGLPQIAGAGTQNFRRGLGDPQFTQATSAAASAPMTGATPRITMSRNPMQAVSRAVTAPTATHSALTKQALPTTDLLRAVGLASQPGEPPSLLEVFGAAYGMHELMLAYSKYQAQLEAEAIVRAQNAQRRQEAQQRLGSFAGPSAWPLGARPAAPAQKHADHEHDRARERLGLQPHHVDNIEAGVQTITELYPGDFHVPIVRDGAVIGWAQGHNYRDVGPRVKTVLAPHMRPSGARLNPYEVTQGEGEAATPPKTATLLGLEVDPAEAMAQGLVPTADTVSASWGNARVYVPQAKQAAALSHSYQDRAAQDLALWRQWHKSRSPQDLQALLKSVDTVIGGEVRRWGGQIPEYALRARANALALKAFETYDPAAGTALSTHVVNTLRKLSREVYKHQDIVRMPENVKIDATAMFRARQALSGELGREPLDSEIAAHLGWSTKKVTHTRRVQVAEHIGSRDEGQSGFDEVDDGGAGSARVAYALTTLTARQRAIFEDITGHGGRPILERPMAAKKHGLTVDQLRSEITRIQAAMRAAGVGQG